MHLETETFFCGKAQLVQYPQHLDERGTLTPFNFDELPFTPCRSFIVSGVSKGETRGQHAHRSGKQMLVCLQGHIEVLMRYQDEEKSLSLVPSSPALIFNAGVWCQQTYLNEESILLVFASEPYNPDLYLNEWT